MGVIGATSDESITVLPRAEATAAYGLVPRLSLDAKLWWGGFRAGSRYQVVDGAFDVLDVSVGAGIGYFFSDKLVYDIPVLVGARLGDRHEVIVGARVSHQLWFGVTDIGRPLNYVMLGGSAAWFWRFSKHWGLMPEVAWQGRVFREEGFGSPEADGLGLQFNVGVQYEF